MSSHSFQGIMEQLDLKRKMPYNKWLTRNTDEFGAERSLAYYLGKSQAELDEAWPAAGSGSAKVEWLKFARTHNAGRVSWVAKVLTPAEQKDTGASEFTLTVRDQHPDCFNKTNGKRKRDDLPSDHPENDPDHADVHGHPHALLGSSSSSSAGLHAPPPPLGENPNKLTALASAAVQKRPKKNKNHLVLPSYIQPTPLHMGAGAFGMGGFGGFPGEDLTDDQRSKRHEDEYQKEQQAVQRLLNIQTATANYRACLVANQAAPGVVAQSLEQIGLLNGETLLHRLKSQIDHEAEEFYREVLIPWQRKRETKTNPPTMGLAAYKGENGQLEFPTDTEYWDKMGDFAPTCRDLFTQLAKGKHKDPKAVVVLCFDMLLKNKHANASGNTTAYFPLVYRSSKKR
mmetsp:Transcript_26287/g.83487  ORF Transcript_26287/g.83487 Transcript_26287/m.83487 type:complete len:399 (+) Transcript_26287:136-1332(+)